MLGGIPLDFNVVAIGVFFMNLRFLPDSKTLLDSAFNKSIKAVDSRKQEMDSFKNAKGKEIQKIELISEAVVSRLQGIGMDAPVVNELNPFYRELVFATIDVDSFKKALAKFSAISKIVKKLGKEHIWKIKAVKFSEGEKKVFSISNAFYGRIFSLFKGLDSSISAYNSESKKLNDLPAIDFELPTIVLAGYPNVGKSTIIGRLTDSKPKVASYPFTTQGLMIGYFEHKYRKIQVIDTPGLLDRPLEKRNVIERRAISALKHLTKVLVFIVDPTQSSGYSIESQKNLFMELKKLDFPIIVAINKTDIASEAEKQTAIKAFESECSEIVLEGESIASSLREKILKELKIN